MTQTLPDETLLDEAVDIETSSELVPSQRTVEPNEAYEDLAPAILRQRLVVEGYPSAPVSAEQIKEYLAGLSVVTDMVTLIEPVTHASPLYGWAGWIHWETSGAHFYAWDQPVLFFSVDVYTCKAFDPQAVLDYTREFFSTTRLVAKGF